MQRALIELILICIAAGVIGTHVVLRRMAFVTEAVTHTVFPGIAGATATSTSPAAAGLGTGLLSAICISLLGRARKVRHDDAVSIVLTTFFAIGIIIVSRRHSFASDLTHLFFGRLLAVNSALMLQTAIMVAVLVVGTAALQRPLVLRAFDETAAQAMGYRVNVLDAALNVMIVIAVVSALRAVGTLVALSMIIAPPATARLCKASIRFMMMVGTLIGVSAAWIGLGLSYELSVHHGTNVGSSAMIAATTTSLFVVTRIVTSLGRTFGGSR